MMFVFPFLVLFCIFLLTYLTLSHKPRPAHGKALNDLPPGRTGWPVFGETLDFNTKLKNDLVDQFVAERIDKYSSPKVFRTSLLSEPMAVLPGPEGNKFLFSNEKKLVQAWTPKAIDMIFPRPSHKTAREDFYEVRKIVHSSITANALRTYVGLVDEMTKKSFSRDWNQEEVNVRDVVFRHYFALICRVIPGIEDPETVDRLAKNGANVGAGTMAMPLNFPGTTLRRAINSSKVMREEIEGIIKERKVEIFQKNPPNKQDVLSNMLLAADGQIGRRSLTEQHIASHMVGLLFGGTDTVTTLTIFIMKYLAEFPNVYKEVLKEQMEIAKSKASNEFLSWEDLSLMRYSLNVVKEVQRLVPVQVGFREATTDFTYGGHKIPKGWKMAWFAQVTHKNPQYFPNPEVFDPTRFEGNGPPPYAFVPFGGGPRMCPGNEYARIVTLVFVHNVVTRFTWEKVLHDEKVVIDPFARLSQGFPIRLYPHTNQGMN